MKCSKCGRESQPDARFCSSCGAPLSDAMGDTTTILSAITDDAATELSASDVQALESLSPGNALLILTRGGSQDGGRFLIDADVTTAGRHPQTDIFLDDITVSRHHAKFLRSDDGLFIEDLGSLNGTYVNRVLIEGLQPLRQGDEIQIGKFRATISLSEAGLR